MRMAAAGLSLLSVAACAEGQYNEQIGGIAGAAAGAYVGSQVGSGTGRDIAMVAGALLGYWAGSTLARRLTEQDRSVMGQTTNRALSTAPNNQTVTWSNPESGNSGSVTPTSSYKTASGQTCRQFSQTVSAGGKSDSASGVACQQPDGSWRVN
ncbi:MAG: glycine zipper 2TM domain-containing protein [Alphaproteobacteria bacterium]|nr:glycine zipper 2TM domain-containing protein [Alphaproteobacteria bacterium]